MGQRFCSMCSPLLITVICPLFLSNSEPNFVSSYDIGNFTYFFFRENAVEHDCGRTVFSRAARVCKNDIGGRFLLEDTWTTFMKARLNCSRPGEIPFNYNELQGTFFLPELELLYGIFTTNVWVKHLLITPHSLKISAVMFRVSNHRSQLMIHYFQQNLNFVVCVLSKSLLLIVRTL